MPLKDKYIRILYKTLQFLGVYSKSNCKSQTTCLRPKTKLYSRTYTQQFWYKINTP